MISLTYREYDRGRSDGNPENSGLRNLGDARTIVGMGSLTGMRHTCKISADSTGGAYALTECIGPRDCGTPYLLHHGHDEAFYVLAGELSIHLRDGTRILGPGGFIHLPRETPHAFVVESEEAHFLVLAAPGGREEGLTREHAGCDAELLGSPSLTADRNGIPPAGVDG